MDLLERKLVALWESRYTAVGLLLIATSLAIWLNIQHFLPGVAVAVLGFMAAVMSVRPNMASAEKFVWIIVVTAVLVAEISNIRSDRGQSDATQQRTQQSQKDQFAFVAQGVEDSILLSRLQFDPTIRCVDGVLKTTQTVAKLSKSNLEAVTGGNSFAFVYPSMGVGNPLAQLSNHNGGKEILSGVTATIYRIVREAGPCDLGDRMGSPAILMGSIAPNEGRIVPPPSKLLSPQLRSDGLDHFHIYVNAQNPGTTEDLYFRRSQDGSSFAYSLLAFKDMKGLALGKGIVNDGCGPIRYVKKVDWTEPRGNR